MFKVFKKGPIYLIKRMFFKHFELWPAAIFEQINLGKRYIPQKKALKYGYWNLYWLLEYLCSVNSSIHLNEKSTGFISLGVAALFEDHIPCSSGS